MIKRTISCCVCGASETELSEGAGWMGWGGVNGIAIDGEPNPHLCPVCISKVAEFVDGMKHGMD